MHKPVCLHGPWHQLLVGRLHPIQCMLLVYSTQGHPCPCIGARLSQCSHSHRCLRATLHCTQSRYIFNSLQPRIRNMYGCSVPLHQILCRLWRCSPLGFRASGLACTSRDITHRLYMIYHMLHHFTGSAASQQPYIGGLQLLLCRHASAGHDQYDDIIPSSASR